MTQQNRAKQSKAYRTACDHSAENVEWKKKTVKESRSRNLPQRELIGGSAG